MTIEAAVATIDSYEELVVHALAIEDESTDSYIDAADSLESHGNPEVAALFRAIARRHAGRNDLPGTAQAVLPRLSPWEYKWHTPRTPGRLAFGDLHYLMTPYHALLLAKRGHVRVREFYEHAADTATDARAREVAASFAARADDEIRAIESELRRFPEPPEDWYLDLDPPNSPEG